MRKSIKFSMKICKKNVLFYFYNYKIHVLRFAAILKPDLYLVSLKVAIQLSRRGYDEIRN